MRRILPYVTIGVLSLFGLSCASNLYNTKFYRATVVSGSIERLPNGRLFYNLIIKSNETHVDTIHVSGSKLELDLLNENIGPGDEVKIREPPRHVVNCCYIEKEK